MASQPASDNIHLVGRAVETAAIEGALESVQSGHGGVRMLAGEPGIGKSTLARFAADSAGAAHIPVYWGFAWEAGGAPAYWPWTQLLGSLLDEQAPAPELTDGLRQLLPGLQTENTAPALQPQQARFRLLESVRRLLDDVSRATPLLLVFEDLHAADADSLHLLHYVARHVAAMPVLIVGTYRDIEARAMPAGDPLWRTCRDADVHLLQPLHERDVRDFVAGREKGPAGAQRASELFAVTEGNPLFLSELVGLLAQRHIPENLQDLRLPASVQQVIRQQIALLPKSAASLLADASVLGREFHHASLAAIADSDRHDIAAALNAVVDAGLLRRTAGGDFRFSHVLHRDLLYHDLDEVRRSSLHLRYAGHLRQLLEAGDEDRWAELARHLHAAGDEHRRDAIDAWRRAARRALGRLAFDDAVASLEKALAAFGEGPRASPGDRYRLLLECAEATLLTGDVTTGQQYCRDAFAIAQSLEDASLMAEAALAWGSVIVVARVDPELVAALKECLAALPRDDHAMRARVQARLAGALQPSANPAEPMDMARDAIRLARSTGDQRVVYHVLTYAISALMDFAPAGERLALNEEYGTLAETFGDVPGQFRSKLRLMIDACEAADRQRMDAAIDDCRRLAERIGLPHYLWRAASAQAMGNMIDGDFAGATALLDTAQAEADRIDDREARTTLPLQRFAVLLEWESDRCQSLAEIDARLHDAYHSRIPEIEFFVKPFIDSHRQPLDREVARRMLRNRPVVERGFAGGDRYTLGRLGEIAAIAGDTELAERSLAACLPHQDGCAVLGLMGSSSVGPVAWMLANITAGLGRHDEASLYFEKALRVAEAMRAPAWAARIHADFAVHLRQCGEPAAAGAHEAEASSRRRQLQLRPARVAPQPGDEPPGSADAPDNSPNTRHAGLSLQRDGELWRLSFDDRQLMLRRSKGLDMLARLIDTPEQDIHVLDLSGGSAVRGEAGRGPPALDDKARAEYEHRLQALREELEEADEFGDSGRAEAARTEIDFISRELARAFGLGGRTRRDGDAAERARVNVRRRLKDAIERIAKLDAEAGRYLENTVKTGTYCRYTPM
jgi:hypothetical protein